MFIGNRRSDAGARSSVSRYAQDVEDRELWTGFTSATLTAAEWTHEAHVRTAFLFAQQHSQDEAHIRLRAGIIRLNERHGLVETSSRGSRPPAWLRLDSEQKLGDVFEQSGLPRPRCTIHDFGLTLPSASAWWDIVHNAGYRGMLRAMTAEQESDFKQRHLQDVQALLDAGTTRLDVGVLVARSEKE